MAFFGLFGLFWPFLASRLFGLLFDLRSFETLFIKGILRFLKWFDVDVLGFQIEICFGLFLALRLFGLLFDLHKQFQNMVCWRYFKVLKVV